VPRFTSADDIECLCRTAAEAVCGNLDDLSSCQIELVERAYALLLVEAEGVVRSPIVIDGARSAPQRRAVRCQTLRRDGIYKLTTSLAREYGTVAVEDLSVAGMQRNCRLARVISDAGFGEIRRQLGYKTGGTAVTSRPLTAGSSKTCSGCQAVKTTLPLRVRTYSCETCGLVLDREENAARNLAALVTRHVAGSGSETEKGRRADRKTPPRGAGGNGRITETH
jgi:putative transposase